MHSTFAPGRQSTDARPTMQQEVDFVHHLTRLIDTTVDNMMPSREAPTPAPGAQSTREPSRDNLRYAPMRGETIAEEPDFVHGNSSGGDDSGEDDDDSIKNEAPHIPTFVPNEVLEQVDLRGPNPVIDLTQEEEEIKQFAESIAGPFPLSRVWHYPTKRAVTPSAPPHTQGRPHTGPHSRGASTPRRPTFMDDSWSPDHGHPSGHTRHDVPRTPHTPHIPHAAASGADGPVYNRRDEPVQIKIERQPNGDAFPFDASTRHRGMTSVEADHAMYLARVRSSFTSEAFKALCTVLDHIRTSSSPRARKLTISELMTHIRYSSKFTDWVTLQLRVNALLTGRGSINTPKHMTSALSRQMNFIRSYFDNL